MTADYKIHRPYVLATLPRPLDHTRGSIVAREVYGQKDASKKRKRTELVVGIDGETTSIYDVPTSRQITSYPIPPQESFTCPPYSVRIRSASSSDIARYTYAVMSDKAVQKITLFKDVVSPDGKTTSTTASKTLEASPVKYITCSSLPSKASEIGDVILVCQNGQVLSLSGETLSTNWSAPTKAPLQDVVAAKIDTFEIEYATSGTLGDFTDGILKHKAEAFSALPKSVEAGEPELLALVARSKAKQQTTRHLIVVAAMRGSSTTADQQRLVPLDISPIPSSLTAGKTDAAFQVDVQAAALFQLQNDKLTIFDLSGAIPKPKSTFEADGTSTFTRLARPFVLSCSPTTITLFNYQYRSMHAKATLDLSELPAENQKPRSCQLLAYIRSQDIAVALVDNVLVSIHVEPPSTHGKRRKEGLLIDSIGRGTILEAAPKRAKRSDSKEFSRQVPGTVTESYLQEFRAQVQTADELLASNELERWESLLREKFHMNESDGQSAESEAEEGEWRWHQDGSKYAAVDRRWVIYALSQVFSIEVADSDSMRLQLRLVLPDSNVLTYLVVAGHVSLSNLRSAFVEELNGVEDRKIAADLIGCITDAEPSMSLLLNYLQATKLGEAELILAIRALMLSMDLIPDTKKMNSTKLLKEEAHESESGEKYEMDLDDLEREIAVTEHYLGDDSSSRSRGLTLAFTKLWRQPAIATVKALRTTVRTEEVLAFIYLLRMELVRGAWTSLYLDTTSLEAEGSDPPPDGARGDGGPGRD
ncbi:hypothetical protein NQ176_g8802 [Zarea fungicola]|uniref:Uncharacterized protein n=1 Tax=Zarea fungicola TaxID=93591 RepID=A0ACC1MS61_9HYPO|nr:hypothetical protein NQ176_g8802 [Lecanicillium fungicola]